jgi:hypothetical protein
MVVIKNEEVTMALLAAACEAAKSIGDQHAPRPDRAPVTNVFENR